MSTVERALGGPEIEVVAKATRRRFTLKYKRKIIREADGCKIPGAVGALLETLASHLAGAIEGLRAAALERESAVAEERGLLANCTTRSRRASPS